jgi:diaminohydroxyphosphoribosylaminopyrimidine deaminase/5-amino-6-(5-phosphoribosylamino)uracil reductase
VTPEEVWAHLVDTAHRRHASGGDRHASLTALSLQAERLLNFYGPLAAASGPFVVGHLGQSLDGRIALPNGASRWITGAADVAHNHRMRALFAAVLVGRVTVEQDDPQLTVREVAGPHPVRVVLDLRGRLQADRTIFVDDIAPTLVLRCHGHGNGRTLGRAEIVALHAAPEDVTPRLVLDELAAHGLERIFVEGGGVTISRFLAAGCLDRLQITIAPIILGSGRPALALPPLTAMAEVRRHPHRRFLLGDDLMIELLLRG